MDKRSPWTSVSILVRFLERSMLIPREKRGGKRTSTSKMLLLGSMCVRHHMRSWLHIRLASWPSVTESRPVSPPKSPWYQSYNHMPGKSETKP